MFDRTQLMEHLAVDLRLSLKEFCNAMRQHFGLPEFEYDRENETEWGSANYGGIEYNVSRPYERETLTEWDDSVPVGCNIGITLIAFKDCSPGQDTGWSSADLVERIAQGLANHLQCRVYHHRTWHGVGKNVIHNHVFEPKSSPC